MILQALTEHVASDQPRVTDLPTGLTENAAAAPVPSMAVRGVGDRWPQAMGYGDGDGGWIFVV